MQTFRGWSPAALDFYRRLEVENNRPFWLANKATFDQEVRAPFDALSEREFEVFVRLARGRSVNDIATQLSLSPSTVGTHLYNIKQKLAAGNQAELTLLALRWGVIEA